MIQIKGNLIETKEIFKEVMLKPERLFEMLDLDIKKIAEQSISELLKAELSAFIGREKYERLEGKSENYRNGSYSRKFTAKNLGELKIDIPRDRDCKFNSKLLAKYSRYDKRLEKDLSLLFLSGLSTRSVSLISKSLIGRKISASEVSRVNNELLSGIDLWRTRSLEEYKIKYIYVDGVYFHMRVKRKIEKVPLLIVIGVTHENKKVFLAIQQGDKESSVTWREVFKDLKHRGLNKDLVTLGIMDGLPGLMTVFRDEFPNAKVQRCQVHVARNVLCKVPKTIKKEVADSIRSIFYASSRQKARKEYFKFIEKYEAVVPSATKCLSNVIDECLTFYSYPQEEWISLRTTNVIERVNKEFKRRTKPMEILAGEASAYRLLCFVALKMELYWRSYPINRKNLTLKGFEEFTQLS